MKGAIDRMVMLLSSDWFRSHWHNIGLSTVGAEQGEIVEQCRDIVRAMMDGQAEYWNVSFEKSRISDTYARFFKMVEKCKVAKQDLELLRSIADESIFEAAHSEGDSALILSLSQLFVQDPSFRIADGGELSPAVIKKLSTICDSQVTPDFRDWCLASTTSWDCELRMLTPDLPDHLADFAELLFNHIDESRRVWVQISAALNEDDRELLANLYSKTAEDLVGERLDLRR